MATFSLDIENNVLRSSLIQLLWTTFLRSRCLAAAAVTCVRLFIYFNITAGFWVIVQKVRQAFIPNHSQVKRKLQ